jgi:uncharacterized protein (TIGR02677 family)
MSIPGADAWELAGFPGRLNIAAYLTADQVAAQYRVLVDVLLDAQEHSLTGVGRDELLVAVRQRIAAATDAATADRLTSPEVFDLDARMKALQSWDVVIRWQDKAKTEADFIRTRDRFQLTSEAADLHRWLRRKIDEDAVATSAAAFAPAIIADRLDETVDALAERDHAKAAQAWAQVRTTLKDMAEAASIWQSRMASALAGSPDEGKMRRLRETLLAYVTVWGAGVDSYTPRIRSSLGRLSDRVSDADWRAMALTGMDAAAAEETVRAVAQGNSDAAQILAVWFGEHRGQALRLRRQVRDAVTPLLRGSRALLATGGRVTRRAELLRVAAAVESAASDADAWQTWCAATGLWGARHLSGTPDEPEAAPRTSFWAAPAVCVDVTLRKRGTQSVKGRPAQVPNRREARRAAREAAARQREATERAEQALAARSGTYLADWSPVVSQEEAAVVWDLLTSVLRTAPDRAGVRTTLTGDDRWIVLAYPAPAAYPSAVVTMPGGRVACENWKIEVTRSLPLAPPGSPPVPMRRTRSSACSPPRSSRHG